MQHLKTHHTSQKKTNQGKTSTVKINGNNTQVEPDTGSDTNIMDGHQFKKLKEKAPNVTLKRSAIKLKALTEDLPVMGEVDVFISTQTHTVSTTTVIIKGKIDLPPLTGRQTLEDLGMVLIDPAGRLKSPEKHIKNMCTSKKNQNNAELEATLERYKERFTGIGRAMRDGQEIQISMPMKDNATPIAQNPRKVPYLLTALLQKRLEEFEQIKHH